MGGNLGMMGSAPSGASAPSQGGMPRMPAAPSGPLTPGSGGPMTPTFGSMAPLAGMFMNNTPPPRAPSAGFNVSQAPIQQPQPNPNPAWENLPTQMPLPPPPSAPAATPTPPPLAGNWAAQFFGSGMDSPYGTGNAMAKLQGWNQSNPQGVQRWVDAGHVPPMRGSQR